MKFKINQMIFLCTLCTFNSLWSQGFIVAKSKTATIDVELQKYEVVISVDNNIARVEIEQEYYNPSSKPVQANYYFAFPEAASVNGCQLKLEGMSFSGEIMEYSDSSELCFNFIKDGLSPSFFNLTGRQWFKGNAYQIPAKSKRSITFKYSQILNNEGGLTKVTFPQHPFLYQRRVEQFSNGVNLQSYKVMASTSQRASKAATYNLGVLGQAFTITLESGALIKNVYSPNCAVDINYISRNKVKVNAKHEDLLENDLVLYYSQDEAEISCNVLSHRPDESEDGYFMLLTSSVNPVPGYRVLPKDVIFVLDVSGSMKGVKFKAAKDGLKRCIRRLNKSDYFNIITYSSNVKIYQKQMVKASEFRDDAAEYIDGLISGGGTNINEALLTALSLKPKYNNINQIVFITDGMPTVGVTDIFTIQENIKNLNTFNFQIHSFAIKSDVDIRLLQGFARLTSGHSEYLQNLNELSDKLVNFFDSVKSPVLGSIKFSIPDAELKDVFGNNYLNIYQEGTIIIVGRYKMPGKYDLNLSGKSHTGIKKLSFGIKFAIYEDDNAFIKQIWQKRKLGFALEKNAYYKPSEDTSMNEEMSFYLNDIDFNSINEKKIEKLELLKDLQETILFTGKLNTKTTIIDDKIFRLATDGYWEDTALLVKPERSQNLLHLRYGSDAYFKLAKNAAYLRPFLAISSNLKLNYEDYCIKIDKSGLEEVNKFPF